MKQGQAAYKQKATDWRKIESIHQLLHSGYIASESVSAKPYGTVHAL